ncbi:MAG: hypothetical protein BGO69_19190 [Bacteroidetes bacterium 46-16]|nr:MAG: hypothetical protein BGO69_19190 [Bacteroidetes bacterium 46-16]
MSGPEALVPLIGSVGMFATIFGIVYLRNRENMALIERGINPRQMGQRPRFYANLKYGLLVLGSGLGLLIAFFIDELYLNHKAFTPSGETYYRDFPQIYFALIAIGGGSGLIISYIVEKKGWKSHEKTTD